MATENTGANENKKAGEGVKRPRPADGKTPAKKKRIIIVTGDGGAKGRQSSGQRSAYSSSGAYSGGSSGSYSGGAGRNPKKTGSGQSGQSAPRREREGFAGGRARTESKPAPHKIIRPSVKPMTMEVDYHKPVAPQRQPRKTEEAVREQEVVRQEAAEAAVREMDAAKAPQTDKADAVAAQTPVRAEEKAPEVTAPAEAAAAAETDRPAAVKEQANTAEPEREMSGAANAEAQDKKVNPAEQEASAQETAQRDYRPAAQRDRSGQSQGAGRRDSRGSEQGGFRQGRSGDQGTGRRDNRGSEQGGYRQGRSGDQGTGRRDNRGSEQGGFRQGRSGDQGTGRRDNRGSEQGGFRQGRSGDQGGFGTRSAKPGQGMRGTGAQAGGRQGARPGFGGQSSRPGTGEGGRRRTGARAGESEGFNRDNEKHRDDNKRKMNQERDKRSKKDLIYSEEDTPRKSTGRSGRFIKPEKKPAAPAEVEIKTITIPEKLTVRELADAMHKNPSDIIKKLFLAGQVMTPNSELEYEEAEKIALDYDILCEKEQKVDAIEELLREDDESEEDMVTRPPVICVMGHVDHGKTSLLDTIRKTNVTRGEAGGITQAIGAYTITLDGRSITFLDTPGHEAFTAMRMRGANSTDIAVLVVAADDGVMPQTIEAINHAKAAGVEIIVAVNKIDKPGANPERVKQELTEYDLVPTDWGGTTEVVPVSAKTGEGIEDLLETILLTADILELKANPNRNARGLVLEAKLDKGRGPVANVLIQKGTLHIGDFISAGASSGKVRAMIDDKGRRVKEAKPSQPVEILGLSDVPSAGEVIIAHETNDEAKAYAETYKNQHKEELIEDTKMRMNLDDLFSQMKEGTLKEFNLIIKADVQGSVEALKQSLLKLSNDEVVVKVIHGGVGAINESDVTLASASNAVIIGFGVRPDPVAKAMAEHEGVDIRLYKVIYQAIDAVEAALKGMLAPVYEERVIGHAEVRMLFKASAVGNIAGSYVLDGTIRRGCKCRITREGEQIFEGDLASLKRFKDDVKEVRAGFECGLVFTGFDKMQVGDIVEAYDLVEVPRT